MSELTFRIFSRELSVVFRCTWVSFVSQCASHDTAGAFTSAVFMASHLAGAQFSQRHITVLRGACGCVESAKEYMYARVVKGVKMLLMARRHIITASYENRLFNTRRAQQFSTRTQHSNQPRPSPVISIAKALVTTKSSTMVQ